AVGKLYTTAVASIAEHGTISDTTTKVPEVALLLEKCDDADSCVATSCCSALVQLVYEGHADFNFVLNSLLNRVPSATNCGGIVQALTDLLILQMRTSVNDGSYDKRGPPHPYITAVENKPDIWHSLLNHIRHLFTHSETRIRQNALKIVSPFVKYALLDPSFADDKTHLRYALWDVLLDNCCQSTSAVTYVAGILNVLAVQCSTEKHIAEYGHHLKRVISTLVGNYGNKKDQWKLLKELLYLSLSTCIKMDQLGMNIYGMVSCLNDLVTQLTDEGAVEGEMLLGLASLMQRSIPSLQIEILHILHMLMEKSTHLNPILQGFLAGPMIQIVAMPTPVTPATTTKKLHHIATKILSLIESRLESSHTMQDSSQQKEGGSKYRGDYSVFGVYTQLTERLSAANNKASDWLKHLAITIPSCKKIPDEVTYIVTSLALKTECLDLAVPVLLAIAKVEPTKAVDLLSVFLYLLHRQKTAATKYVILSALPSLAVHKLAMRPAMKTLLLLCNVPDLKPTGLRLLTSLWQQQDRCFPYLQRLLLDNDNGQRSKVTGVNELLLSKAACIRDICVSRPHQHGADMLGPLSKMLNDYTDTCYAPVASLALQGIHALCKSEVIDIRTTWAVLAPKLTKDDRPLVQVDICRLFSLVPSLAVETQEFQDFYWVVVESLWKFTLSTNDKVVSAAYDALAQFPASHFKLSHLPDQVKAEYSTEAEDDEEDSEKIPGDCFMKLLSALPAQARPAFVHFLTSLVQHEVDNMPRGVHHKHIQRQQVLSSKDKTLSRVAEFILQQHEGGPSPSLQPAIAASMLFCYDPQVEMGKDGRVRKHYIISHGRNYEKMLPVLLNGVPIELENWHMMMLLPQAWAGFIERCFYAMFECRQTELQQQSKREDSEDWEQLDNDSENAWIWVRDKICEILKRASRGAPNSQGNSILALAGLLTIVTSHTSTLDEKALKLADEDSAHLSNNHWKQIVCDTIMAIAEPAYRERFKQRKGSILNIRPHETSCSLLAKASACLSLPQLLPFLITTDTEAVLQLIDSLTGRLPGQPGADDSSILKFHHGLALGMLISKLFEEHFSNVTGSKGMLAVWKALDVLEDSCCFDTTIEGRSGAILGLGVALTTVCNDGKPDSRAHIHAVYSKLLLLMENTGHSDKTFESVTFCVSIVTAVAYNVNILTQDIINSVVDTLYQNLIRNPQMSSLSLSLGLLCYSVGQTGHNAIELFNKTLTDSWAKTIKDKGPVAERVSCLTGLLALTGSERNFLKGLNAAQEKSAICMNPSDVISLAIQQTTNMKDVGSVSHLCYMLGHFYSSMKGENQSSSTVPGNYSYLPDTSVLRAVFDKLSEIVQGGRDEGHEDHAKMCLTSLDGVHNGRFPPVQWAGILSSMMRLPYDVTVKESCLKVAIAQSSTSSSAVLFLTSWLLPPLFYSLPVSCQRLALGKLPILVKSLPVTALKTFCYENILQTVTSEDNAATSKENVVTSEVNDSSSGADMSLCQCSLEGLYEALRVPDPPQSVTYIMYQTVEKLYPQLPSLTKDEEIITLAKCMFEIPDVIVDRLVLADFTSSATYRKGMIVRCYLVSSGHQDIQFLNDAIETLASPDCQNPEELEMYLVQCLHKMAGKKLESGASTKLVQWLVSLMGLIASIENKVPYFTVLCAFLTTRIPPLCLRLVHNVDMLTSSIDDTVLNDIRNLMSYTLPKLALQHPWNQALTKMIDWMIKMSETGDYEMRKTLCGTLLALRGTGKHSDELQHQLQYKNIGM
ncbi:unnamed protein product, partial [Owenia fusiformis]